MYVDVHIISLEGGIRNIGDVFTHILTGFGGSWVDWREAGFSLCTFSIFWILNHEIVLPMQKYIKPKNLTYFFIYIQKQIS